MSISILSVKIFKPVWFLICAPFPKILVNKEKNYTGLKIYKVILLSNEKI